MSDISTNTNTLKIKNIFEQLAVYSLKTYEAGGAKSIKASFQKGNTGAAAIELIETTCAELEKSVAAIQAELELARISKNVAPTELQQEYAESINNIETLLQLREQELSETKTYLVKSREFMNGIQKASNSPAGNYTASRLVNQLSSFSTGKTEPNIAVVAFSGLAKLLQRVNTTALKKNDDDFSKIITNAQKDVKQAITIQTKQDQDRISDMLDIAPPLPPRPEAAIANSTKTNNNEQEKPKSTPDIPPPPPPPPAFEFKNQDNKINKQKTDIQTDVPPPPPVFDFKNQESQTKPQRNNSSKADMHAELIEKAQKQKSSSREGIDLNQGDFKYSPVKEANKVIHNEVGTFGTVMDKFGIENNQTVKSVLSDLSKDEQMNMLYSATLDNKQEIINEFKTHKSSYGTGKFDDWDQEIMEAANL